MVTVCVEVYVPAAGLKVGVATLAAQATVLLAQNANRKRKRLKKRSAFL
jgi:hypothetical protein